MEKPWECAVSFRAFIKCLNENKSDIGRCQVQFSAVDHCTLHAQETGDMLEQLGSRLWSNRFLSSSDEFGREEGVIARTAKKVMPQVFDEDAPKKQSTITRKLQETFPRFFNREDDDAPEEGGGAAGAAGGDAAGGAAEARG